jgi:serine/threonine protein kinase
MIPILYFSLRGLFFILDTAPEILLRKPYDQKADMWSVGVIIYCLLSGRLPFIGKKHLDLFKSIISGVYTFDEEEWNDISNDAKDLIRKLLVTDPSKRLSASEALQSRWLFVNRRVLRRTSLINTSTRMRTFNARLAFKSAILVTQSVIKWRIITRNSLAEKKAREDQLNKIGSQFENTSESEQHEDNSES